MSGGFMAGFGSAFAQSFENQRERTARREDDLFKVRFESARKHIEDQQKKKQQDAQDISFAKSVAETTGIPEAWTQIYRWKRDGWSEGQIFNAVENGTFNVEPNEMSAPEAPQQVEGSSQGLPDPRAAAMAEGGSERQNGLLTQTLEGFGLKRTTTDQRVDRRVAEAMGMSPDEFEAQSKVTYDPSPIPGDPSKKITYVRNPKTTNLSNIEQVMIARDLAGAKGDIKTYEMYDSIVKTLAQYGVTKEVQSGVIKDTFDQNKEGRAAIQEEKVHNRNRAEDVADKQQARQWVLDDRAEDRTNQLADRAEDRKFDVLDTNQQRGWQKQDDREKRSQQLADRAEDRKFDVLDTNQARGWKKQDDREQRGYQVEDRDFARTNQLADRAEDRKFDVLDKNQQRGWDVQDMRTKRGWEVADRAEDRKFDVLDTNQKRGWDVQDMRTKREWDVADAEAAYDKGIDTYREAEAAAMRAEREGNPAMADYYRKLSQQMQVVSENESRWDAISKGVVQPVSATVKGTNTIVTRKEDGYYDAQGKRYGLDDVVQHTPQMMEDVKTIIKETKEPVREYTEAAQALKTNTHLAKEMVDIVNSDEATMTFAGDISEWVSKLRRDVNTTIDLAKEKGDQSLFINPTLGQSIIDAEKEIEARVNQGGFLNRLDEVAVKKALLEAKATRMAYAYAASLGQTGKAVAVQEYEKMYNNIMGRGGGAEGFRQGMAEWLAAEQRRVRSLEQGINQHNASLELFKMNHGIDAPVAPAPSLDAVLGPEEKSIIENFSRKVPAKDEVVTDKDMPPMPEGFPHGQAGWAAMSAKGRELYMKSLQRSSANAK